MAYGNFKGLPGRVASDKICDKAFDIDKNPKHVGYQRRLASMVYRFFGKKSSGGSVTHAQSETLTTQNMKIKLF